MCTAHARILIVFVFPHQNSSGTAEAKGSIPHDSLKLECAHGDGQEGASTICKSSEQVLAGLFESLSPAPPLLAP